MNRFPKIILTVFLIITVLTSSLLSFGCDESYFTDNGESSQESEALPYYQKFSFNYGGGADPQTCRFDKEVDTLMSEGVSKYNELQINVILDGDITLYPEYIELVENEPLYDTKELKLEYRKEMEKVRERYNAALIEDAKPLFSNVNFATDVVFRDTTAPWVRMVVDSEDMDGEALEILKDIAKNDLVVRINISDKPKRTNGLDTEY